MVGTKLGHYRIDSKLGQGGMGVVYRATDLELDRAVAIKTLLADGATNEDSVARFLREAKAASRLQHPSIVTVHHVGVEGEVRYVVMEMLEGESLKAMIQRGPMAADRIIDIGTQVADGLVVAHDAGVIHRDIKPENIMVLPRGQVKILDFGLAKLREAVTGDTETAFHTQVGTVMGTVTYMSPEQALGSEVDARTDVFSLGVVLYEMASGQSAFAASSVQTTLARILGQEPTPILQVNPDLPPALAQLIHSCMTKDRNLRPTSAEVLRALRDIRAGKSGAHELSPLRTVQMSASSVAAAAAAAAPAPVSSQRASGIKPPSGVSAPRPSTVINAAPASSADKAAYQASRAFRVLFSIATLTVPLSFLGYFLIGGGVIKPQIVEGTVVLRYMQAIVLPALELTDKVFTFRAVYQGWNFMLGALAVLSFVLRQFAMMPVEKLEHMLKDRVVKTATGPRAIEIQASDARSSSRLAMLREYSEAKKVLFQEKRDLAFLSIDVVGSTKMKIGEDKLSIEHAFAEYKKFVERILKDNGLWKVAWTPDGIMCAFFSADDAVNAAKGVLGGLAWFNDGVHNLKTPFNVRCGVNGGEVVFPEEKNMEDISDEVIDVAGHMQKYAAHGALWLSREVLGRLTDRNGFRPITDQKVDGRECFEWRADQLGASVQRGASTPAG